jgi:putative salt-induced outer membrane protein YdiY
MKLKNFYLLGICLTCFLCSHAYAREKQVWQPEKPVLTKQFDWLRTSSGEWIKGDLIVMYNDELEFDSDNFGIQSIDIEDVAELYSKSPQSIRLNDGTITSGIIEIVDGELTIINQNNRIVRPLSELLSIASAGTKELDYWDGKINFGTNFRRGNTEQSDFTIVAEAQRRTTSSRLKADYISNFSERISQETGNKEETINDQRLTAIYDWYFSPRFFFRAANYEFFSDEFGNIDTRHTLGIGIGYEVIDTDDFSWEVSAGPSFQKTTFIEVDAGENDSSDSAVLSLATSFSWEITKDIDFDTNYQVKIVSEEAGKLIHRLNSGLNIDLIGDFELDLDLYLDRINTPKPTTEGIPEKNDYRFVVSLAYEF